MRMTCILPKMAIKSTNANPYLRLRGLRLAPAARARERVDLPVPDLHLEVAGHARVAENVITI
jgi:hypothetical protein